ncbi:hypothetical protein H0266_02480 [Halobacillus locisalis]|uniref:DUF4367 domain-containing protein n=1 Tax=Halobacillus locisalis TaxID=220753 RepID=A0A838CNX0_9BACI|nr:hypothetical protein [Halobacillus locisalis]MBA2173757.1 hypothetical protein [Halobacillus locisalis]
MRVKHIVVLSALFLLICTGCTNQIDAESTFDHEEVAEDMKQLTIHVELPTSIPFEPYDVRSSAYPNGDAESYSLSLYAAPEAKEGIAITAVEGNLSPPKQTEKVELANGRVGYFVEQGDVASMFWEKDNVSYHAQHVCEDNRKLFSKEGFIGFVNQFH